MLGPSFTYGKSNKELSQFFELPKNKGAYTRGGGTKETTNIAIDVKRKKINKASLELLESEDEERCHQIISARTNVEMFSLPAIKDNKSDLSEAQFSKEKKESKESGAKLLNGGQNQVLPNSERAPPFPCLKDHKSNLSKGESITKEKNPVVFGSLLKFVMFFLLIESISGMYALFTNGVGPLVIIASPLLTSGLMFFVAAWPIAYAFYSLYKKQLSGKSCIALSFNTLLLSVAPILLLSSIAPTSLIASIFTSTCFLAASSFFIVYKMQNGKKRPKLWPDTLLLGLAGLSVLVFAFSPSIFVLLFFQVSPFVIGGTFIMGAFLSVFSIHMASNLLDGKEIPPLVRIFTLFSLASPALFFIPGAAFGVAAEAVFAAVCVLPFFAIVALCCNPPQVASSLLTQPLITTGAILGGNYKNNFLSSTTGTSPTLESDGDLQTIEDSQRVLMGAQSSTDKVSVASLQKI